MAKKKKVNPRKVPVSQSDLMRVRDESIHLSMAIFLTVLKDDFGFDNDQIALAWDRLDKLSKEVAENRVNLRDLVGVLAEEYNIDFRRE